MKTSIAISAIVVTWRRPEWLERCVASLRVAAAACPGIELEVRIGVNGDDSRSLESARSQGIEACAWSKRISPAAARNELLSRARGEWVLFIDDDAYVPEGYFDAFLSALDARPDAIAVGGPNLDPPGASRFERATGSALATAFGAAACARRYRRSGDLEACGDESLILCNLFVRRAALQARPFPEHLVCAEENSMLDRLKRAGAVLVHAPALWVWHERRSRLGSLARQMYAYGFGRGQLVRDERGCPRAAHLLPALGLIALLTAGVWSVPALGLSVAAYAIYCALGASRAGPAGAALFPVIHAAYGAGFFAGLARGPRPERAPT